MLRRLGVIGVSWRADGSEALADFTISEERLTETLDQFARDNALAELAYLSTCNRVELLFLRSDHNDHQDLRPAVFELLRSEKAAPGEAERTLKAWAGEGAAEHLFLVTAALDSACIGEVEIAGQVRRAHERALQLGHCGSALDLLFNEAYRVMSRIRGETEVSAGRVSLAEIAVDQIKTRFKRSGGQVALIGVSAMTMRAAVSLKSAAIPFTIVNRSIRNAASLAKQYDAPFLSLQQFRLDPPPFESVLSCTGAAEAVLDEPALARIAAAASSGEPPLLIDMSVPPDIDPDACAQHKLQRIGMDDIVLIAQSNRNTRESAAAQAREIVDEALADLSTRFTERYFGPMFGALQKRYQRTAREGVERLLKKDLPNLAESERDAIKNWSESLARRFAHVPCAGLRGLMRDGPEGSLDAFLDGLDAEFASELRAAYSSNET